MAQRERGLERRVLMGPDLLARGAATVTSGRSVRWMLGQSQQVRRSYVAQVVDRPAGLDEERAQQAWMLRQPDAVRESFIAEVLARRAERPSPQVLWMLRQGPEVRESYVLEVLEVAPVEPGRR